MCLSKITQVTLFTHFIPTISPHGRRGVVFATEKKEPFLESTES